MKSLKRFILVSCVFLCAMLNAQEKNTFNDGYIKYGEPLSQEYIENMRKNVAKDMATKYDVNEHMISVNLTGKWNYHADATVAKNYHPIYISLQHLTMMLNTMDDKYLPEAEKSLEVICALQEKDKSKPYYGIWGYYKEEPLATKKSPPDYNMADFFSVRLIDIYINHKHRLSQKSVDTIKSTLILAGESIKKRNMGPHYTNIAIMGTYASYMIGHLFNIEDMKVFAKNKFEKFCEYTDENNGFREFNSPAYTTIALLELERMSKYFADADMLKKVEKLKHYGWETIGRHWHSPSMQWANPSSRSYTYLLAERYQYMIEKATGINLGIKYDDSGIESYLKLKAPADLAEKYFINPKYPRVEKDLFIPTKPEVIGICTLNEQTAFGTLNRSMMWNQRRPFSVFFSDRKNPMCMTLRFMRDNYDLSAMQLFTERNGDESLSVMTFAKNGGLRHPWTEKIKDAKFEASDLRLRFQVSGCTNVKFDDSKAFVEFSAANASFKVNVFYCQFDNLPKGKWVKSVDNNETYIDYVIYSGENKTFDLNKMEKAALAFTFSVNSKNKEYEMPSYVDDDETLKCSWQNMEIEKFLKPMKMEKNIAY